MKASDYAHADLNELPLNVLTAWIKRRYPDMEFSLRLCSLGVFVEVEGDALAVGRIEAIFQSIKETGLPS